MAQAYDLRPSIFGLGLGLGSDILSSHIQDAYPDNGCWETLYPTEEQHQSSTGSFYGNSLDTTGSIALAQSITDTTPVFPDESGIPAKHPPATAAAIPPSTPPPPVKRGRGRPRKNETTPGRPKKKVKISLPSPSISQASSQALPTVNSRPEDNDDEHSLDLSSLEDTSETRIHGAKNLERRRDRNREAAHKCRARKQHSTQKLVADVAAAEAINESLRLESNGLREETLLLKNMVLQHGNCDCAYIQTYIKNTASMLTVEDGGRLGSQARSPGSRMAHEHQERQQAEALSADVDEEFFFR